jgi:NAD(P)-dependent dehydrogenase (short-subunit alcohol dehydrogenase family)
MDINFFSAVELLKGLTTKKINGKNLNNVILVSSIAAFRYSKGEAFYAASKSAVNIFARAMADELAPNVRVNTINPGITRTSMMSNLLNDKIKLEQYNRKQLLGFCESEDIANIAEFLMSDKASKITGQHFIVDGGATVAL